MSDRSTGYGTMRDALAQLIAARFEPMMRNNDPRIDEAALWTADDILVALAARSEAEAHEHSNERCRDCDAMWGNGYDAALAARSEAKTRCNCKCYGCRAADHDEAGTGR